MDKQMKERKNNRKKKQLKRKLASMTAMVLVLMVGILGTLAYLSTVTETKTNVFTGSKGIGLELTEPDYDPDEAGSYTPGKIIAKNPILTNITNEDADATEWVAMAVSYQISNNEATADYKPISYNAMKYLIKGIEFKTTNADNPNDFWIPVYVTTTSNDGTISDITLTDNTKSNDQAFAIYLYNKTLGQNEATVPLFSQIEMKDTTALETTGGGLDALTTYVKGLGNDWLKKDYEVNGNLPGFKIDVIGAAVKNEYKKTNDNTGALATNISELSDADKNQLIKDLVEVLGPKISEDVRKVGGN